MVLKTASASIVLISGLLIIFHKQYDFFNHCNHDVHTMESVFYCYQNTSTLKKKEMTIMTTDMCLFP